MYKVHQNLTRGEAMQLLLSLAVEYGPDSDMLSEGIIDPDRDIWTLILGTELVPQLAAERTVELSTARQITKLFGVPDYICGIKRPWWVNQWQRYITRRP